MGKTKIVAIFGSPRRKGNTATLLREAIRGARESGAVVEIDARKLLPIEEEQLIVVEGTAQLDDLGNLVVSAKGVYVRR